MSSATEPRDRSAKEEIVRLTETYRQGSFLNKAPPITMYHDNQIYCPWPGCGLVIRVLAFNGWEASWDEATRERLLAAFWKGEGLMAKCPNCGQHVLFALTGKKQVLKPEQHAQAVLPADWLAVGKVGPLTVETPQAG
jgi:hypothetical protein